MTSMQHKLDRVRRPRVQITYDVEIGNAIEVIDLPFVIGVLADLAGTPATPLAPLKDRKFIHIDRDNINDVMSSLNAQVPVRVKNMLGGGAPDLNVLLSFKTLDDLNPTNIIAQVPALSALYTRRGALADLLTRLDGNDALDTELRNLIDSPELVKTLQKELAAHKATQANEKAKASDTNGRLLASIIKKGKLARLPAQTDRAKEMLAEFVSQLASTSRGHIGHDTYAFIVSCINHLDKMLSSQMDQIMHHPDFQRFEASWRGLAQLVFSAETGEKLKIRVWIVSKKELLHDLETATEFDQSQFFKKVYEEQYGTFGGIPFSCLLGDYTFGRDPQDIKLATLISNVAACAHTPFIAAAAPSMFNFDSFSQMSAPRDLTKLFEGSDAIKWRSFRETEDSRYFVLTLPHVLMRLPYGKNTLSTEGFDYEESVDGRDNTKFCWGNPAYAMGQNIAQAFSLYGWTAAIRGVEGGGLVSDLPAYTFKTTNGDIAVKCPTEITITDRREKELSDLGFIALCYCKHTDYAAFFSAQTAQKPKLYNDPRANANARLSARLSYMLNASRFAHYIKAMMRDKVGTFMSRQDVAIFLNSWIAQYVLLSDDGTEAVKASYPLRAARIEVVDVPGKPGNYSAIIFLRPFFQMEELTVSLRLVATLPNPSGR